MSLFASTRTVMIGRALGVLAAFGAFVVISRAYGTTAETDVFFCAYAIPYAVLVIVGATLSQTFIPIHARTVATDGDASAAKLSSACLNITTLAMTLFAGAAVLAAPFLARLAAGGLEPRQVDRVADQMRWLLPLIIFGGAANLAKGILNARNVFFTPSLDTFATWGLIIPIVWLGAARWGIEALVIATVAGNVARLLVMAPDLRRGWSLTFNHPALGSWTSTLGPLVIGSVFLGANIVLMRHLASLVADKNGVSYLGYAERLVMVPSELIAASMGVAILPAASRFLAARNNADFGKLMSIGIRSALLLLLPAAAGIAALAVPVVTLVYGGREFNVPETAVTLRAYAPILPAAIILITGQAFFAMNRSGLVILLWAVLATGTGAIGYALMPTMNHAGIALGYALSSLVVAGLSLALLKKHESKFPIGEILGSATRMTVAAAMMGGAVWWADRSMAATAPIFRVIVLGIGGAVLYALLLSALRAPEWIEFRRRMSTP